MIDHADKINASLNSLILSTTPHMLRICNNIQSHTNRQLVGMKVLIPIYCERCNAKTYWLASYPAFQRVQDKSRGLVDFVMQ